MDTTENEQLPNVQRLLGQPLLAFNCLKMIIYLDWLFANKWPVFGYISANLSTKAATA